jgi:hypothetical protein
MGDELSLLFSKLNQHLVNEIDYKLDSNSVTIGHYGT